MRRSPKLINFSSEIEELRISKGIEYIDAIILWCEKNSVEIEVVADWIKKDSFLKSNIQTEAENLKFLKVTGPRLPI